MIKKPSKKQLLIISFTFCLSLVLFLGWYLYGVLFLLKLILVVFSLLLGILLIKIINTVKGGFLKNAIVSRDSSQHHLEADILEDKLKAAISTLKTSSIGLKHGKLGALYLLPWYVLIGPSSVGKSTILRNSSLDFPLFYENKGIQGIGGTRFCDWWFANNAVMLDTAGRYTNDLNESKAWNKFLVKIKRYRRQRPINGLIVVLSIEDLITANEEEINQNISIIRAKISNISLKLGIIPPVYFVFSKLDKLYGFNEFFANLSEDNAKEPLGFSFNSDDCPDDNILDKLNSNFAYLVNSLRLMRFAKTKEEQSIVWPVFSFPEQFLELSNIITKIIIAIVKSNPYLEEIDLKGIYFTSSTTSEEVYKLNANGYKKITTSLQQSKSKSFFINGLFEKVIIPSNALTRLSALKQKHLKGFKYATYSLYLLAVITMCLIFTNNISQAIKLKQAYISVARYDIGLSQLYDFSMQLKVGNYKPKIIVFGLSNYKQYKKLIEKLLLERIEHAYIKDLISTLHVDINKFHKDFSLPTSDKMYANYYNTLSLYLALTNIKYKDKLSSVTDELKFSFDKRYLSFYLNNYQYNERYPEDITLISLARDDLKKAHSNNFIYHNLIAKIQSYITKEESVNYINITNSLLAKKIKIKKIFTKKGFSQYLQPSLKRLKHELARGDLVLDKVYSKDEINTICQDVVKYYADDYKEEYYSYLRSIKLVDFNSFNQAIIVLNHLRSQANNYLDLIKPIISNTLDFANHKQNNTQIKYIANNLKQNFKDLDNLKNTIDGASLGNQYLNLMAKLQGEITNLSLSYDIKGDSYSYALKLLSNQASSLELYKVYIVADSLINNINDDSLKIILRDYLLEPIKKSWQLIYRYAIMDVEDNYKQMVYQDFTRIKQSYPFSFAKDEVSVNDFESLFAPSRGKYWQFIDKKLKPLVGALDNPKFRYSWLDINFHLASDFQTSLKTVTNLTKTFFNPYTSLFSYHFYLYPIPTGQYRHLSFSFNKVNLNYQNGPQEWQMFEQSSTEPATLNLEINFINKNAPLSYSSYGAWSLFKLIQQGRFTLISDRVAVLDFNQNKSIAKINIKTDYSLMAINALAKGSFNLSEHIFDVN